ncbi:MAG TPA: SpoIID/LytB domain-containing protein [Gaiellaceae bacterium]|nr:SpoIID/LytB domain-containing protein [Gaiellaceae bacterium]
MLRTLVALIGGALALAGAASARPDTASQSGPKLVTTTSFLVSGRGWGHGVGMSQYGALGFANEGRSYAEILAHYYTGTALSPAPVARVRVLVVEAKGAVTVSSKEAFRVRDVFGKTYPLAAGAVKLGPKLEVPVNGVPTALAGPILFLPGKAPLVVGTPYRGQIEVAVVGKKLNAVNAVGLEDYLAGVVPREMPSSWASEALKAQAVAARSYALAHRVRGKAFDLYADVRSQVYGGVAAEDPRATQAIAATAGEVLTFEGKIADTLFHSTSGGATISAEEAFGTAVPYLTGVDDPFSSLSPVHLWGPVAVRDVTVRNGLKLGAPVLGLRLVRAPSGRVTSAVVKTTVGQQTVSGSALRSGAGLRSTWVTKLASVSLTRPAGPAVYGQKLSFVVRGQGTKVSVQWRVDGAWEPVGGPGTKISLSARLHLPTRYRLLVGNTVARNVTIPVAPRIAAKRVATGITGKVTPAREGATVQVQRLEGEDWLPAGQAVADASGAFLAELELTPGSYRVRTAPAAGFAQGLSATIRAG